MSEYPGFGSGVSGRLDLAGCATARHHTSGQQFTRRKQKTAAEKGITWMEWCAARVTRRGGKGGRMSREWRPFDELNACNTELSELSVGDGHERTTASSVCLSSDLGMRVPSGS
jgi:hypothetical protein